ncbi:hypothetical protein [Microbacterium sp. CFBP 8794]|uniref:hypothetical protein n=1 Tax=Microbacterium sp. CFBP 8794 TaxID=2775269 RepID=UPI0017802C5F|nr:hypothetical protein [Microbacterium sp. CFBP 8794]MBD8477557.1 hypothetical protein [Microbacterium sp. CFBP 8794]
MFARMWRASIWHPEAIPVIEGQISRDLKRVVLPLFDVALIVMGVAALAGGMPSFDLVHNHLISAVAGWALLVGGTSALFGVVFPRLWVAEAAGKLVVLLILGAYAGALWALVGEGSAGRALTAGAFSGLLALPLWNLVRLGRERRARRTRKGRKWSG